MAVLELSNLKKGFRAPLGEWLPVIDVPAFAIGAGEQVALAGESGMGKTTLLHLIAGILTPDEGEIHVAGKNIARLSEAARDRHRAAHLGYVFQNFNLLHSLTALENITLAMRFGKGVNVERAKHLLERVGLAERMNFRPAQLSIGQQQRVAVARAVANSPELVLADEPTGNLDRHRAMESLGIIRDICRENNAALLLVSHDPAILSAFPRRDELGTLNRAFAAVLADSPPESGPKPAGESQP